MGAASFAGVLAARLATGESVLRGRSRCDACGEVLGPLALVPLLSYAAARGRASCCGARLPAGMPISELALGGLFVLSYLELGLAPALPFFLIALVLLAALVLYDLAHQILPPPLLAGFLAACALTGYLAAPAAFFDSLTLGLALALFLALIHFFSGGRAMGLADAPLVFALALLTGPYALSGFLFSFWIGAVIGITVLLRRPRGSRMGVEMPFAPYLAAGFLLAYFTKWNIFGNILNLVGSP